MNNQYFDIINRHYNSAEEWVVKTFICLIGFAVFELVSIVAIDSIPTVDVSMIYVPADLISNGVEPTKTVSHDNVPTSIIHGGFAFLKLFVCASIVVYLFKLGSVSIRFNEGQKQASELVPTIVRLILVFSLFGMIPMGESSALYLVNKYNLEIEHAAQMDYSEILKVYQAIPSDENWKTIEPLFSIKVNRPYLDYIKSATGDKKSINHAVQDFQSGKLHLPDNDRYICTLERKANVISKRSQSCAEYIDCVENILLIVIWVGRIITALFVFCLTRYIGIYTRVKRCAKYQMMESK